MITKKITKKKNKTQVFTDSNIVNLILDKVGYKKGDKIIDMSCGNGAFTREIVKRNDSHGTNIYGFDIDETVIDKNSPANLFLTPDSLCEEKIITEKFDIVASNPPYLGYNECHKQKFPFFTKIKKGEIKLNNIFGVNLHSTPDNPKKYSPKPNLYAFFMSLGLYILKDNGVLGFLIPKNLFSSSDLDTLRYYLAKNTTICEIISFDNQIFKEKTSSIIIIVKKSAPTNDNMVKINSKEIPQSLFLTEYENWNVFLDYDFILKYRKNTDDLSAYFTHKDNKEFYFDKGMMIGKKVTIPQGSQGLNIFKKKYRIVWRYMNPVNFELIKSNEIISHNYCLISSDNYDELLFLSAILNSSLSRKVINLLFKNTGEKDVLLGIKSIKKHIRIPKDTLIKTKIIEIMKSEGFCNKIDTLITKFSL